MELCIDQALLWLTDGGWMISEKERGHFVGNQGIVAR